MSNTFSLPTHCFSCGVVLMGGATQHLPLCEIGWIIRRAFEQDTPAECTCRTPGCGHGASLHIGGHCFECGRTGCWR